MGALHGAATAGAYFTGDLIGYSAGLFLTVLLLALALRASRLPGSQPANVVFAVCGLLWSVGGLAAATVAGAGGGSRWTLLGQAIQYTGVVVFPIPVLAVWQPYAEKVGRARSARRLAWGARAAAAVLGTLIWSGSLLNAHSAGPAHTRLLATYNATFWLAAGAWTGLRKAVPRPILVPSLAIVLAAAATSAMMTAAPMLPAHASGHGFGFVLSHLIVLVILCSFFLFARFRFADVFVRYGVRILLAGTWASILVGATQSSWLSDLARRSSYPQAVHILAIMALANALLLSFTLVDDRLSTRVNQWLFRVPDYAGARRELAARLTGLIAEGAIFRAVEEAVRGPMELESARVEAVEPGLPHELLEGEVVELANAEVAAPVATGGKVTHALRVVPGPSRPGLVMQDLNYLRSAGALCGARLDALGREREAAERQSREAMLEQQITEAELRALRAQIHPHFLFNALNTVADQIVRNPQRAETMTLRLANVFRHLLAHSARPLTTIRDEVEFLRAYLHIEEARFGDRLEVRIEVEPEVEGEMAPSLILQPLVENALKHGLGPKTGPGRLWISAKAEADGVRMEVEDDGIGSGGRDAAESEGTGLRNVAERLETLYRDRASVRMEAREGGGTRVTVRIPRAGSGC